MSTLDRSTEQSAPDHVDVRAGTRISARAWLGVVAIGLATFSAVTAEMLPVGLLPGIANGLGVSTGVAGLTVTAPGVVAAVAALLLPAFAARVDRKVLFCALVTALSVASLGSAVAPTFAALLASRVLIGICVGGLWAMMVGLAGRLVAERHVGLASGVMFSGVAAASVLGVPAGTLLGELVGWRASFGAMAGLTVLVLAALWFLLPALPARSTFRLSELPSLAGRRQMRSGLLVIFFLVTGHFAAYTYVAPFLVEVSGVPSAAVSAVLMAYGVAGIIGNFVAGATSVRRVRGTIGVITLGASVAVIVLPLTADVLPASISLVVLWGLFYGGVSVSAQSWTAQASKDSPESAGPLMSSVFNFSISFGALVGGRVVDAFAPSTVMWLGAGLVLVALLVTVRAPAANS